MRRWKKLLFCCVAIVLSVVTIDLLVVYPYLRYVGFYFASDNHVKENLHDELPNNLISHPRYIWSYIPGSRYTEQWDGEGTTFRIQSNSQGFRGAEPDVQATAEYPFVALGDSFTFGWLVEQQDRWDEQLAQLFQQRLGVQAASVNLGVWMSTFDQHALILEDHFPRSTRAVIHLVYPSHIQTIQRHKQEIVGGKCVSCSDPVLHIKNNQLYYGAAEDRVVSKTLSFPFLLAWARFAYNQRCLENLMASRKQPVQHVDDKLLYEAGSQPLFTEGWRLTESAIRQTADLCRARGVPYVVVLVPRDLQLSPDEWNGEKPVAEILNSSLPQDRFRQMCSHIQGVYCLDLLPAMRNRYSDALYFKIDPHWRPSGHRLASEVIFTFLQDQGLTRKLKER